jgi:hypothetical protein
LNLLGIMVPCSRIAMMNPTIVSFDMENRQVIEGFKNVKAVNGADDKTETTSRPVFNQCLTTGVLVVNKPLVTAPILTGITNPGIRIQPNAPGTVTQTTTVPKTPGIQTITLIQPTVKPLQIAQPIKPIVTAPIPIVPQPIVAPIISGIELGLDIDQLGQGIPIKAPEQVNIDKFNIPTVVGIPTINPNPLNKKALIYVGAGKNIQVLDGRTYLAQ